MAIFLLIETSLFWVCQLPSFHFLTVKCRDVFETEITSESGKYMCNVKVHFTHEVRMVILGSTYY